MKHEKLDLDGDWIPNEGAMPVDGATMVEVKQVSGHTCIAPAKNISWSGRYIKPDNQVAAYRVVSHDPKVADDDGWIPHTPGDPMPVAGDVLTEAKRRDGVVLLVREAGIVDWGVMPDDSGREIVAYKIHKSCPPEELKKFGAESTHFDGVNEYGTNHPMYRGFMDAIDQATGGKGQRHGGATIPFLEQRWHNISKSTGFRGLVYQAVKKAEEATEKPDYESFERELLGAMVYLNMALIHVREHGYTTEVKADGERPKKHPNTEYKSLRVYIQANSSKKFEVIQRNGCGNGNDACLGAFSAIEDAIAFAEKMEKYADGQ